MGKVYTVLQHESKALTSSSTATLQIPPFGKIQNLMLGFFTSAGAAATEADIRGEINNIRVTINGKDLMNVPAYKLYDLYETLGTNVETPAGIAGFVELNLGRLLFVDPTVRDIYGLGMADVSNVQIQVQAGTLTNIATVKAATRRTPEQQNLGDYFKFINYPQSFNSTGQHTVDTLPRDLNSDYFMVLADDGASGAIASGEVRVNSNTIHEDVETGLNDLINGSIGFAQPSGYYVYNFCDRSFGTSLAMQGVKDLRFLTNFSTAPGAAGYNMTALTLTRNT